MIHEFAVDPQVMSSWQTFRYLNDQFGVSHGRMISRFPKEWKRMVYDACSRCAPMEKTRIEVGLRMIENKLISTGRPYSRTEPWIANARRSHQERPFRKILTAAANADGSDALDADSISSTTPDWHVPRDTVVARTTRDLVSAAATLLEQSSHICFVDQHYSCKSAYGKPLAGFLIKAFSGKPVRRLEYHLNGDGDPEWFRGKLDGQRQWLNLPEGVSICFVRWRQLDGGDNMHPRYILTDLGGIRFDYGLDEAAQGQTTDVALLDDSVYRKRWEQFQLGSTAFNFVDAWIVSRNSVVRTEASENGYRALD